jgi:ferredoxin-type protein NapH
MKIIPKISINPAFSKSIFTSILLTFFFTIFTAFFYLGSPQMEKVNFIIRAFVVLFYSSLFFLMMKSGNISKYRSIFFVTFALMFVITFISNLFEIRGSMYLTRATRASLETPFCHRALLQSLLPVIFNKEIISPARMAGIGASVAGVAGFWFLSTFTIGRGFCSWICFFGGLDEGFTKLGGKKKRWNLDKFKNLRYLPFSILIFIMLAALFTYEPIYCKWFCAFKTTTEFVQIVDMKTFFAAVLFIGIFATTVVAFPILTKKRTQCGLICPFGAFQSFFNKTTIFRVKIDKERCIKCKKCISECPNFSITEDNLEKGEVGITCNRCGKCIDACPKNAIDYKILGIPFTQRDKYFTRDENKAKWKLNLRNKLNEILDARVFLIFTAYLFGTVIASGYIPESIQRILNLITKGTLLLN